MRCSTKHMICPLYLRYCLNFPVNALIVVFFVIAAGNACPRDCTCTPEKILNNLDIGGSSLILEVTKPPFKRSQKAPIEQTFSVDCQRANLENVLEKDDFEDIDPSSIVKLDLSHNKIEELESYDFEIFSNLRILILSNNKIKKIESKAFHGLSIKVLNLNENQLPGIIPRVFPDSLEDVSLEGNFLTLVPSAVSSLSNLKTLNLGDNKITAIHEGDFRSLTNLIILNLNKNRIIEIDDRAFAGIPNLQILDLDNNELDEIPSSVLLCPNLVQLHLGNNRIAWISEDALQKLTKMEELVLTGNPLEKTHVDAFRNLPSLKKLILKESWKQSEFPNLNGTHSLELIRIDRASLKEVPQDLCSKTPKLRSLVLHRNKITKVPKLEACKDLRLLDLSNNEIKEIEDLRFERQNELQDLLLQNNLLSEIRPKTFVGLRSLQVLNLESNLIQRIDKEAFIPLKSLEDINLGNNYFPELPSKGFERVVSFKAHNNRFLKEFPDPSNFPSVHSLVLSYAYHCCPFLNQKKPTLLNGESSGIIEDVVFSVDGLKDLDPTFWNVSSVWPDIDSTKDFNSLWANLAAGLSPSSASGTAAVPYSGTTTVAPHSETIECIPTPGPFMPCKDLFDWWTLRCGIWIVFLLALLGNGVVVVVLIFARAKMDVPRFLVTNLALADFFMGIYLGFLAIVDASTLGEFRMYAIPWQMSTGCRIAGFFGVLSSELSVYTLTVITLERNYAITHAMHLNKRLSLRHAAYIMSAGWVFSIVMATLPIMGISDYRKFAVCLPFETAGGGLAYVIFLMFINGIAFLILMGCYLKIYCAIRGSQAWNSNDSRIAKRMALLVFTDFLCWAPIAFLSLTAASGVQLISLEEAKIFTIFILPLNSCCNPFLYALLTKQFKKDCVMLCKTIEESRVTRGIGRCRHSSNFSNRQTPANTNSAIDPISKGADNQICVCHSKQKKHSKLRNRLRLAAIKYFLCNKSLEETNGSNEYTYQQTKATIKSTRNASLSSETYSSSWSETLKRNNMPIALRILDKRHPNWMLSRKSSQDSNMSSSRNDSSATTASTSTWRISRSSVSSDISSGGSKGLARADLQSSNRINSLRDRRNEVRTPVTRNTQHPQVMVVQNDSATGTWVSSIIKGKPKLQRQVVMDKDSLSLKKKDTDINICPLHHRQDLSCVLEQESYEEDDSQQPADSHNSYISPPNGIKTGLVQKKLSTSKSMNVIKEGNVDENSSTDNNNTKTSSIINIPTTKEEFIVRNGRCFSLSTIIRSPAKCITGRCPSDGQVCSRACYEKPKSARSIDCIMFSSQEKNDSIQRHQSPLCTETTALMASDSDDDDVFLEEGRRKTYETHFPIEGEPEITYLIKESS